MITRPALHESSSNPVSNAHILLNFFSNIAVNGCVGTVRRQFPAGANQADGLEFLQPFLVAASDSNIRRPWLERDRQGRVTRVVGSITDRIIALDYGYDAAGRLCRISDLHGHSIEFGYDLTGSLRFVTFPEPLCSETLSAPENLVLRTCFAPLTMLEDTPETDCRIHENREKEPCLAQIIPFPAMLQNEFDNLTAEIDPLGNVTSHTYDDRDFMTSTRDPLGNITRFEHDAFGNVSKTTDPRGNVTRNVYDNFGNLLQSIDALGNVTTNEYFPRVVQGVEMPGTGPLKQTTDPMGNVTSYEYMNGYLSKTTDALGHATSYGYNGNGDRTQEVRDWTPPSGSGLLPNLTTVFTYDNNSRLTQTLYPDGTTTKVEYYSNGEEKARIDQLNHRTEFTYDEQGRLTTTTYAVGTSEQTTEQVTYDLEGRRKTSQDRAGRITTFEYDSLGRLFKTIRPFDLKFTLTTFDSAGRVIATTDAKNNTTRFDYDSAGRRIHTIAVVGSGFGPRNIVTTFSYDSSGNQHSVTDALEHTMYFEYDSMNRQFRQEFPDSTFTLTEFDSDGHRVASTDQAGITTHYGFDSIGRLASVTDANNKVTQYRFDEVGNRIEQEDALHRITKYEFDAMGRRTKRILPRGESEVMTFDLAGNLKTRTDFNGRTTIFDYDNNNRLTTKTPAAFFTATPITFTYTQTGQRLTMTDGTGVTTYGRDDLDRVTSMITPRGTLTYEYDDNSNMTSAHTDHANGMDVRYNHDELNRLTDCVDAATGTTHYTFDDIGNLKSYDYPNGVAKHEYTYNTLNRLTNLRVTRNGNEINRYEYTLWPAGNRRKIAEFPSGILKNRTYTYDNLYRLTSENIYDPALMNRGGTLSYTYDDVGNRLSRSQNGTIDNPELPATTTYSVDDNDRLAGDLTDAAGNTTNADAKTFSYDFENRIISMTKNGVALRFQYSADGDLVSRFDGADTTYYLVIPGNLNPTGFSQIAEEIQGGSVKRVNTYGLDLISRREVPGGNTVFYLYDGLGSVRGVVDGAGTLTTYDYDAFGTLISAPSPTVDNPYLFTGERYDASLGLYYLRARYMEPGRGHMWTMDSFEGTDAQPQSLHKYLYANGNDPVNRIDPSGYMDLASLGTISIMVSNMVGVTSIKLPSAANSLSVVFRPIIIKGSSWTEAEASMLLERAALLWFAMAQIKIRIEPAKFEFVDNNNYLTMTRDGNASLAFSSLAPGSKIMAAVFTEQTAANSFWINVPFLGPQQILHIPAAGISTFAEGIALGHARSPNEKTAAHEIGHVFLGPDHTSSGSNDLMAAGTAYPNPWLTFEQRERARRFVRGL